MRITVFGIDVADKQPTTERRAGRADSGMFRRLLRPPDGPAFAHAEPDEPATGSLRAGMVLSVLSIVPALLFTAWVVAGFPLAAFGVFEPGYVVPAFVVVAAVLTPLGLSLVRRSALFLRGPWWSAGATIVIAAGFTVFTALSHSSHVVVRRDAGSYAQIGYLLAHHAGPFVTAPYAAFGADPGQISFASPAFYQHGATIIPQFMTGWPEVLAGADWVGGWTGLLLTPTVVGGCAILALGGLAGRLMGARWAPLAALLAAGAWPILRASQETLSEPLALLMLTASGCLLVDLVLAGRATGVGAADADNVALHRRIRWHCAALGLLLTASELVRLDFGIDFAFVLPVLAWLWLTERPGVVPFLGGAVIGGGLAALDGEDVTRIYVMSNWSAVRPMLELLGGAAVAVIVALVLVRRSGRSPRDLRWWGWVPPLGVLAVVLIEIGLIIRPWVLVDHSTTDRGVIAYVETMQRGLSLPVDGTRGYAELSLYWVGWYVGWPMIISAFVAAGWLTWRVLRGRELRWLPILLVFGCSALLVLLRPSITPDHPWADRRLVVEVLPTVVLLAVWATAGAQRWVRANWSSPAAPRVVVVTLVASFLVAMGFALTPVAVQRTEQGEPEVIARVCATLRPGDVVVELDQVWMPVIRQQCGRPVAQLVHPSPNSISQVSASIRAAGGTPVVVGSQLDSPITFGLDSQLLITLDTREDARQLVARPTSTVPLRLQFWLARP